MIGGVHDHSPAARHGRGRVPAVEEHFGGSLAGGIEERLTWWVERQHTCEMVVEEAGVLGEDHEEEVGIEGERVTGAWFGPFRDDDGLGIGDVEPVSDAAPQPGAELRSAVARRVVLHE